MVSNVLIAHQSTIPHYRIPFYNALERQKPVDWRFEVVFDTAEFQHPRVFQERIEPWMIQFPIYPARLHGLQLRGRTIYYQSFWRRAGQSQLVIIENAVNNLAYPLASVRQRSGVKIAYWGHGKDRSVSRARGWKNISEKLKLNLARNADGFFAYTPGVAQYLISNGLAQERIFTINNTIDINAQHAAYQQRCARRPVLRQQLGLENCRVLLFSGRLKKNKRIEYLLEAYQCLVGMDARYTLLVVGSGGEAYEQQMQSAGNVRNLGPITDLDVLADLFTAADIYLITGLIGLGPLHAQCYELPVVAVASPHHGPEVEYLSPQSSLILDEQTDPQQYAQAVHQLFENREYFEKMRLQVWPGIEHLTIEKMAQNFIDGINTILGNGKPVV